MEMCTEIEGMCPAPTIPGNPGNPKPLVAANRALTPNGDYPYIPLGYGLIKSIAKERFGLFWCPAHCVRP